jgi:hypothetical protein
VRRSLAGRTSLQSSTAGGRDPGLANDAKNNTYAQTKLESNPYWAVRVARDAEKAWDIHAGEEPNTFTLR